MEAQERMIQYFVEQKDESWASQFKKACMLTPSISEADQIDYVTGVEAFMHFSGIGWKVLYSTIPPVHYGGGWFTFFFSLCYIGIVTAIMGECAKMFGCAIGVQHSIIGITFVAVGASIPDTFASIKAA